MCAQTDRPLSCAERGRRLRRRRGACAASRAGVCGRRSPRGRGARRPRLPTVRGARAPRRGRRPATGSHHTVPWPAPPPQVARRTRVHRRARGRAGSLPAPSQAAPSQAALHGPAGSGPAGTGPAGSGPAGSGPAGSGPADTGGERIAELPAPRSPPGRRGRGGSSWRAGSARTTGGALVALLLRWSWPVLSGGGRAGRCDDTGRGPCRDPRPGGEPIER